MIKWAKTFLLVWHSLSRWAESLEPWYWWDLRVHLPTQHPLHVQLWSTDSHRLLKSNWNWYEIWDRFPKNQWTSWIMWRRCWIIDTVCVVVKQVGTATCSSRLFRAGLFCVLQYTRITLHKQGHHPIPDQISVTAVLLCWESALGFVKINLWILQRLWPLTSS